jgi:hypothetical protein
LRLCLETYRGSLRLRQEVKGFELYTNDQ